MGPVLAGVLQLLALGIGEDRIGDRTWPRAVAGVEDEEAQRETDLRRGEPDPGGVVHGLQHVLVEAP